MADLSIKPRKTAEPAPPSAGILVIEVGCLIGALTLLLVGTNREAISTLGVFFVSIVLEAMPFVILGALLGGFIEVFVPQERVAAVLPARGLPTVLLAGLLGVIFPVCECAVVPVIRRLVGKGVPLAAAVTYLLAGPIVNPLVAASTAVAYNFDWTVVILRMVCGYVVAVTVGLVAGRLLKENAFVGRLSAPAASAHDCCQAEPSRGLLPRVHQALDNAVSDFLDIGRFLVLGAFIAALIQTYVQRSLLLQTSETPAISIGLMMVMAVGLNLCSEADAFVAASFRVLLPLSAQMAFMVLGPMLDIKLLFMYLGVFRKRAIVLISTLVVVCVFIAMVIVQRLTAGIQL